MNNNAHAAPSTSDGTNQGRIDPAARRAYLIGGGIASLASAAYLIRDGGVPGRNISILEETDVIGGSLDGDGPPEHGYVIRGGRMFTEEAYTCMFNLLSLIPSLTTPGSSVKEEIYEFNSRV
jgi:oleate hydratase